MTNPTCRPALSLKTEKSGPEDDDEYHGGPFTQCKACQSSISFPTSPNSLSKHGMISRKTSTAMVRSAVFNTHELLENILYRLPVNDLLTARRVTLHWNAIIMTSPRLRRKLFLQAEPVRASWTIEGLGRSVAAAINTTSTDNIQDVEGEMLFITIPATLNPMLFTTPPTEDRKSLVERVQVAESIYLRASPDLSKKDSIYHSMLVSQPPAMQLAMDFEYTAASPDQEAGRFLFRHERRTQHLHRKVSNASGVTFGDILREFRAGVHGRDSWKGSNMVYSIRAGLCSVLRMSGVVFATEREREMVRKGLM